MTWWLSKLDAADWAGLRRTHMDRWLWTDTERPGLHCEATLPAKPPRQATHLWGWGRDHWVRVRIDPDLPGGLAGAALVRGNVRPDGDAHEVAVESSSTDVWSLDDGRVAIARLAGISDGPHHVVTHTAYISRASADSTTVVPAVFVQLSAGPASPDGNE